MIIGVYLLLPVYQVLFRTIVADRVFKLCFFGLWFLACCVPVYFSMPLLNLLYLNGFLACGGFFMLGGVTASS